MISLIVLCGILAALYFYNSRAYKYWEKRGVKYGKPIPVFGNAAAIYVGKKSFSQFSEEYYWKYPQEKAVGFFRFSHPNLLVRDPDLIKAVWVTDFQHFNGRGIDLNDEDSDSIELLRKHSLFVEGDLWRLLRQGTTPAFSSAKLKAMFPLIVERAERLQERTRIISAGARPVDARDLMARYTIDFIGACGFGVDGDALQDENSSFRNLGAKFRKTTLKGIVTKLLKNLSPYIFKRLKYYGDMENEFCDLINEILRQRNYKPSNRHDFIDLMLELRMKGKMECESKEKTRPDGSPELVSLEMDDDLIAAQVGLFFVAGFDTSTSSTSATLHEIAYNPRVQNKIQTEIDLVLAKHDNKLCYEAIKEMHYLEWSLKEGMRIMPPVGAITRVCRRKHTFQELGVTIDEGTCVVMSAQALHNDPKYWDKPEEFRPERFSPEINEPKHKYAYLPFGAGPRGCIGERMGMMQSMAGLAAILWQFSVAPAPSSVRHPAINPTSFVVQDVIGGYPLIFSPRT